MLGLFKPLPFISRVQPGISLENVKHCNDAWAKHALPSCLPGCAEGLATRFLEKRLYLGVDIGQLTSTAIQEILELCILQHHALCLQQPCLLGRRPVILALELTQTSHSPQVSCSMVLLSTLQTLPSWEGRTDPRTAGCLINHQHPSL